MRGRLYSSAAIATVMVTIMTGAIGAARADNVQTGDIPGSWKIPGTNTSFRIGGSVQFTGAWDEGGAIYTPGAGYKLIQPSTQIPLNGSIAARQHGLGQFGIGNSNLQFYTSTPTDIGVVGTFFLADMYGDSLGSPESSTNGRTPRVLFYGLTLGGWKVGQAPTEWKDVVSYIETINDGGTYNAVLPLIRFTKPIFGPDEATASLELGNAAADVNGGLRPGLADAGLGEFAYGMQVGDAQMPMKLPNLVLKYIYEPSWGRVGLAGNVREIYLDGSQAGTLNTYYANGASTVVTAANGIANWYGKTSLTGYGIKPWFTLNNFWGKDQFQVLYEYGVADQQYIEDSTANTVYLTNPATPGTAFTAAAPGFGSVKVNSFSSSNVILQYEHWWTDKIRTAHNFTYAKAYNDAGIVAGGTERQHVFINSEILYSPIPSMTLGIAYDYTRLWTTTPTVGVAYVSQTAGGAAGLTVNNNPASLPKSQGSDQRVDFKIAYSF